MTITWLRSILNVEGYKVQSHNQNYQSLKNIHTLFATKGRLVKKELLFFVFELLEEKNVSDLIEFIKTNNPDNKLCLVLCNVQEKANTNTLYVINNKKGACIIHFVYFVLNENSFVFDLDFNYYQSSIVKKMIANITKNIEPFSNT